MITDRPRPLKPRPPRKMPTMWAIVRYWTGRGPFGFTEDELAAPFCFGCGIEITGVPGRTPATRWESASGRLERAHLVDRFLGGLDGPQNIVPLCVMCHRVMPVFDVEHGDDALAYVTDGGWFPMLLAAAEAAIQAEKAGSAAQ